MVHPRNVRAFHAHGRKKMVDVLAVEYSGAH